ncbi:hypothetical protein [Jonesia quinghaiensis]|uniref:hypothetical protein n=1 Tax=Jonesia quinghaiensis TaxID=262806 RepID=UPI000425FA37|nr:hypothetical protein [Jonesia quinghaiensis]
MQHSPHGLKSERPYALTSLMRLSVSAGAMLLAIAFVLMSGVAGVAAPSAGSLHTGLATDGVRAEGSASEDSTQDYHQVVFLGTGGIRWADVSEDSTPSLYQFARSGAIGNLVVRNVRPSTCPADGWLALSAGNRAGDALNGAGGPCRYLEEPAESAGSPTGVENATVPTWDTYTDAVAEQKYSAQLGTFGQSLSDAGVSTAAVGPGAAIALADSEGTVRGTFFSRLSTTDALYGQMRSALNSVDGDQRLVVADVGHLRIGRSTSATDPSVMAQLTEIDSRVDVALQAIRAADPELDHTTVILGSLSDPTGAPRLSVLAMAGRGVEGNLLTSPSTKQDGFNQSSDLPVTVHSLLGANRSSTFVGSTISSHTVAGTTEDRIASLVDEETHTLATRPIVEPFFLLFCVVNIALFAVVSYIFSGRSLRRISKGANWVTSHSRGLLIGCQIAGIAIATIPVATLLANLVPWWRTPTPTLTLTAITLTIIAGVVALALAPLWRGWRFGPIAVVSAITVAVLAIDVATGARLQMSALMGVQPMVGGRFYGFNNQAFALFATSTLLLAGALANSLVVAGRRRLAALTVAIIGITATLLNGLPSLGADFGGPPALFPAFALLTLWAGGVKLNFRRVAMVMVSAVVVVSSFAIIDWLRPADDRTHLGMFVDTVLAGGFFDVVGRKLGANFSTFTNPLSLVAITAILVLLIVLGRPVRLAAKETGQLAPYHWLTGGVPLKQIATDTPLFLPTVNAVYVALAIGTMVNDSGVVIVAIGLAVLVPLLIATYARWILSITKRIQQAGLTSQEARSPR